MAFITEKNEEITEAGINRQRVFEEACSAGVKAAASRLADGKNSMTDAGEIEEEFFRAMAARLGIEGQPFYADKLKWYVPVICIVQNDGFELIYASPDENGIMKRKSHGRELFGNDAEGNPVLICENTSMECISRIESKIEAVLNSAIAIEGENICFDLPEYSANAFVRTLNGPCVLAVSADRAFGSERRSYAVYAAEITADREYCIYEHDGRKEIHYSDCEIIRELLRTEGENDGKSREDLLEKVSSRQEAAEMGAYPAACCDPLGAYCFEYYGY